MTGLIADHTPPPPAADASAGRIVALDRMRAALVGLVVLHHAILAYCTFGRISRFSYALSTAPIVDAQRWVGFDVAVRLNDSVLMPALFLLSGVFVHDGLARRTPAAYLRARLLRLGLPFAVAELTVVPLAYYPSYLQAGGASGFARFWATTVTAGPWPSGPPWFIGVLLLFDAAAVLALRRRPRPWPATARPGACFGVLLGTSCLLYLPLLLAVGPTRWISVGPLAVQGSRIGLYAAYFAAGVALGLGGRPSLARFTTAAARQWPLWLALAVAGGLAFLAIGAMRARWPAAAPGWAFLVVVGTAQASFCAAGCLALPALFLRFGGRRSRVSDSLAANGFAIYLLHYPIVTWVQYALLPASLGAATKATLAFAAALVGSWAAAASLRRLALRAALGRASLGRSIGGAPDVPIGSGEADRVG